MRPSVTIEDLLYPRSRMQTLRTLLHSGKPLSLRKLSEISLVPLRSTQLAVEKLKSLGVVSVRPSGNKILISIDSTCALISPFKSIIAQIERQHILNSQCEYIEYSRHVVSDLDDMAQFITKARKRVSKCEET